MSPEDKKNKESLPIADDQKFIDGRKTKVRISKFPCFRLKK